MPLPLYSHVFVFLLLDICPYQPPLINLFSISCHLSFAHLLCQPTQVHPLPLWWYFLISRLIKSKFQWWINLPELMRWSVACCYQSTCCQVILFYWDVWHYEVHLEPQLSHNGSNQSKSIFGSGRLFLITALLQHQCLFLLMSCMHALAKEKSHFHPVSPGMCCPLSKHGIWIVKLKFYKQHCHIQWFSF